jgi:hypothetical protein
MRHAVIALLLLCGFVLPATAFDQPKALLEAVYAGYQAGGNRTTPETYYSARLKGLYAANLERQALDAEKGIAVDPNAPPVLDFDPFIEGNHALIAEFQIGEPVVTGSRAVATVSFANFDHRATLAIAMVREGEGWKVDDIASLSGENWLLSWLLQYDPFGGM